MATVKPVAEHSVAELARDLRNLGVVPGDILFVHSSYKSVGPVAGGAAGIIAALEEAVGPAGLLLFPAFNLKPKGSQDRAAAWNPATTPSSTGWLSEFFRQMPGNPRSDHYSHSVSARGPRAAEFVAGHTSQAGPKHSSDYAPWGCTYGVNSPMYKAWTAGGKCLFLGTDWHTCTYAHLLEAEWWARQRSRNPEAGMDTIFREAAGAWFDSLGKDRNGKVGDADCKLFRISDFMDAMLDGLETMPERFVNVWEVRPHGCRRLVKPDPWRMVWQAPAANAEGLTLDLDASGRPLVSFVTGDGTRLAFVSADAGISWTAAAAPPAAVPAPAGLPAAVIAAARGVCGGLDFAVSRLSDGQVLVCRAPVRGGVGLRIFDPEGFAPHQVFEFQVPVADAAGTALTATMARAVQLPDGKVLAACLWKDAAGTAGLAVATLRIC